MPGKSRHGRRKPPRSKRKKGSQAVSTINAYQTVVAPTTKAAPRPEVSAPAVGISSKIATLAVTQHSYIAAELRRIGILAGIMLVILIILVLVFS